LSIDIWVSVNNMHLQILSCKKSWPWPSYDKWPWHSDDIDEDTIDCQISLELAMTWHQSSGICMFCSLKKYNVKLLLFLSCWWRCC